MKISRLTFLVTFLVAAGISSIPAFAQEQQKTPDMMEIAENEADRLQRLLDLEDWQVFYVDSTLKHDYPAMQKEMEALSKARVSNQSMYIAIQDKWMDIIDVSYRKIFNDDQWAAYLKSGAAKQQKARAKRKEKSEEALKKQKK